MQEALRGAQTLADQRAAIAQSFSRLRSMFTSRPVSGGFPGFDIIGKFDGLVQLDPDELTQDTFDQHRDLHTRLVEELRKAARDPRVPGGQPAATAPGASGAATTVGSGWVGALPGPAPESAAEQGKRLRGGAPRFIAWLVEVCSWPSPGRRRPAPAAPTRFPAGRGGTGDVELEPAAAPPEELPRATSAPEGTGAGAGLAAEQSGGPLSAAGPVPAIGDYIKVDKDLREAVEKLAPSAVFADGVRRVPVAALREHHKSWWRQHQQREPGDGPAFGQVIEEVIGRRDAGGQAIPYMVDDATGGLADPVRGGLLWGVEIAGIFPPWVTWEQQVAEVEEMLRELRELGLTTQEHWRHQYEVRGLDYTENRDGWRLVFDHGWELISPKMRDGRQVWQDLAMVMEIRRRHGMVMDQGAGGAHVHVSLGQAGADVRVHHALRRLVNAYLDLLFRWGTNPLARAHRGSRGRAAPPRPDSREGGYGDLWELKGWLGRDRDVALNFQHVFGQEDDHVEFRWFDGTGDEAVIQVYAKLALALAHAAMRLAGDDRALDTLLPQRLGARTAAVQPELRPGLSSSPGKLGQPRVYGLSAGAAEADEVERVTELLFWREADRSQVMAKLAVSPWYRELGGLRKLASIFHTLVPGAVVFTPGPEPAARAAGDVAAVRAALGQEQAFVAVLNVRPLGGWPRVMFSGVPEPRGAKPGLSQLPADLERVPLAPQMLAALLPGLPGGAWQPGMPVVIALDGGGQNPYVLEEARQAAEQASELLQVPVFLLLGDTGDVGAGVLPVFGAAGPQAVTVLPPGPAFLRYGESPEAPGAGPLMDQGMFDAEADAVADRLRHGEPGDCLPAGRGGGRAAV